MFQTGEQPGMVNNEKHARFFWPTLRGIALILASCGFIAYLAESLHGDNWGMGFPVFVVGSVALLTMTPRPGTAIKREGTEQLSQLPWFLIAYCVITGVGFNWICVFRAFSQRHGFSRLQLCV